MGVSFQVANIAEALAECLEVRRRGGNVDECLQRYPEHREELMLLLKVAERIKALPPASPTPELDEKLRQLLERIRTEEREQDPAPRRSP